VKGRIEDVRKGNRIIGYRIVIEMPRTERYQDGKTAGRTRKKRLVRSMRGKEYHEAYDEMQRLMAEASTGELGPGRKDILARYLQEWLSLKANLGVKARQGYELNIRRHINPTLGAYKLSEIQPIQIQKLYRKLLDAGLAPRTVEYVHATLHAALQQAVKWRMISYNPAAAAEPPRPKKQEKRALTAEESRAFFAEAINSKIYELLALAAHTGMRRGELLALKWTDIDDGVIHIVRALVRVKGVTHIKELKEGDDKYVGVGESVLTLLGDLRKRNPHDLVFCRENGKPLDPDTVSDWAKEVAQKAGFPDLTLHGLRHTNASVLRAAGVDMRMIQERLGHHSMGQTFKYTHIQLAMQKQVADLLDNLIPVGHQKGTNLPQNGNSSDEQDPQIH
jgi:integrase